MRTDSPDHRCDKPNCGNPAAASLSFRYETGELWIGDLAEPHPSRYALCHYHAENLTAPRGWERIDERTASVERLPLAAEAEREWGQMAVGGGSVSSGRGAGDTGRPSNRYAALSAELPRLAAEVRANDEAADEAADRRREEGAHGPPLTSRELSPMPADAPGGVVLDFDRPRERRDAAQAAHPDEGTGGESAGGEDAGDEGPHGEDAGGEGTGGEGSHGEGARGEGSDGDDPPPDPATG